MMATQIQDEKFLRAATAIKKALDAADQLKNELARLAGERDYFRNRVRYLEALAILVLGEEHLPINNPDLQSLVASYFRTAVSMTPESAMAPLLEGVLKSLSPTEEAVLPEAAEVTAEELLAK